MTKTPILSAEERQRRLNQISRDYMRGNMDLAAFAAAEDQLRPDFTAAIRTLAAEPSKEKQQAG